MKETNEDAEKRISRSSEEDESSEDENEEEDSQQRYTRPRDESPNSRKVSMT